jgi:uncharacterized membrane protein
MKNLARESNILNFIKYGAISLVILLSILITVFFITQKNMQLKEEIHHIEKEYINLNKQAIENLVNKIYSLIDLEQNFQRRDYNQINFPDACIGWSQAKS